MAAMIAGISTVAYLPSRAPLRLLRERERRMRRWGGREIIMRAAQKRKRKREGGGEMLQRDSSRKLNGSTRGGDFGQFLPLFLFYCHMHAGGFRTGTERY